LVPLHPLAGETPILTATEADVDDGGAAIVPVVRYLIERGGDPAKPDAKGCTPMHNAAEFGASINSSPLIHTFSATSRNYLVLQLRALVWTLKFLRACTISLICAVPAGHVEVVRLLLSKGVPVDPVERRGTPLHLAAVTDNHQALKLLLDHGADVSCRVSLRCYPVALAVGHTIQ